MHNRYLAERGALRKGDSGFSDDAIRGVDTQPDDSARAVEQMGAADVKLVTVEKVAEDAV